MNAIRQEFRVGRVLRGTRLEPGGHALDLLRANADAMERRIVELEFETYRDRSLKQVGVLLDAVESDEPIEAFEDQLLAHDSYVAAIDPSVTAEASFRVRP